MDFLAVRGGGDLASGTIHRLFASGYRVLVLECDRPTAIRREVAFCEAVYDGVAAVEGVTARRVDSFRECQEIWSAGEIPLMVDPQGKILREYRPAALIDGILAKQNLGTDRSMADLTIALGPGFSAGEDVDYVVETMRGHNLGRIIRKGSDRRLWKGKSDPCSCRGSDPLSVPDCRYCGKGSDPGMDWRGTCKSQPYRSVERNHPGWCQDFGRNEDRRY